MKNLVYVSVFILMFLTMSFLLAFLNVDMSAKEAWGYYSEAILPSLLISGIAIGLTIYFENKRGQSAR